MVAIVTPIAEHIPYCWKSHVTALFVYFKHLFTFKNLFLIVSISFLYDSGDSCENRQPGASRCWSPANSTPGIVTRDFPRPDLGPNIDPFPIQKLAKASQNGVYYSQFIVLHLGENFMKILTKIAKLPLHENLHKNVNENMFSFTFLCKFFMRFYEGQLKQHCLFLIWF